PSTATASAAATAPEYNLDKPAPAVDAAPSNPRGGIVATLAARGPGCTDASAAGVDDTLRSADWDEAYRRLCLCLRAHGLRGDRCIARLAERVLASVDRSEPKWKSMHPTAVAIAALNEAAAQWFGALGKDVAELDGGGAGEINGKLAMLVLQDA